MTPAAIITELTQLDLGGAQQVELERAGRLTRELRGYLDVVDGRIARRATELHEHGHGVPPEDLLARAGKSSRRAAERAQRRGDTLGLAPAVERQLAKGRISTEHADALANAANRLDADQKAEFLRCDDEMAQAAASMSPERFRRFAGRRADQLLADGGLERSERQRAQTCLTMGITEETGMGFIRGELHPEAYQRLRRAIDGEVGAIRKRPEYDGLRREQLNAIALVGLATDARSACSRTRVRAEVTVLIDEQTLRSGPHLDTLCEYGDGTPLPVATARRLACDAAILPVVLGGDSVPLDVGRARRRATPEQRVALRAMHRTCAIDGCDRPFDDSEIHHLLEWGVDDGLTDLENLLPLCSHHHHRAHEGRWRLELDPDTRELAVWLPNGALLCRCLPDLVAERLQGATAGQAA